MASQEENEFDKGIILHQQLIATGNDEKLLDPLFCIEPKSYYRGSYDMIVECLQTKCGVEAEESKAWASYYVGEVKAWTSFFVFYNQEQINQEYGKDDKIQGDGNNLGEAKALVSYRTDKMREHAKILLEDIKLEEHLGSGKIHKEYLLEIIEYFEKSLAQAKSCKLRYLASWKLGEFYGMVMKPLQEIRCYKMQLQEAEATGWKRAKVCALFNLCGALCLCGQFEEAIEIQGELEALGCHDPFTMGLSLHRQGQIAHVMGNFTKCIEANSNAIDILVHIKLSGVFEPLHMSAISQAISQIEKAEQGEGVFGEVEFGANVLQMLAVLKEEDEEFDKSIIRHQCQCVIPGRDVELVEGAIQMLLLSWVECNEDHARAIQEPNPILERIMQCLKIKCRIEAEESKAWASYYVGELLAFQENFEAAIDMFEQSLLGKSNKLRYLASLELANIYSRRVNYVEESRNRMIQLQEAEATTWKGAKVYALYLLCIALCRTTQFIEAIRVQKELAFVGCDDILAEGLSFHCQGTIAEFMGNCDESIQAHRQAIAILGSVEFEEIKDDISGVWVPVSLAQYLTLGAIADARSSTVHMHTKPKECGERELQRRANQIIGMLNPSFGDDAVKSVMEIHTYWLLLVQGEMHLKNSNFDKAETVASKLLEISKSSHEDGLYARALMFRAEIAHRCCQNEDIIESLFLEAEKLVGTEPKNRDLLTIIRMQANLYFSMRKYDKAYKKLQVCFGMFMDIEENFEYHSLGRICYLDTMKACFVQMQASILYPSVMLSPPSNMVEMSLDNIQSTSFVLEGNQVKDALIWAERERARDLLYGIQNRLHQDAYLHNLSDFDKKDDKAWSELQSICSLVGQDTVFIIFTIIGHAFYTYFFHASDEPIVNVTVNTLEKDYPSDVPGLPEATDFILHRDVDGWETYLRYLFNICIRPFKERLEQAKIKKIIIVPNGEISLIPFPALIDDDDGQFLIQKYEISIISSLRLFKHCEMRRQHLIQLSKAHSALVVGNPTYDLDGAGKEAELVTSILKGVGMSTNLLMKEQATTQAVLSYFHTSFWIHMSCHATFKDKVPNGALMLSRVEVPDIACKDAALVLSSNSYDDCRDIKNAGTMPAKDLLTAEKIASGDQLKAVVTVLSACSSGKGQLCAEGTLGLTRSLHLAGVPTVVASTWDVEDGITGEFMKRFYTNIQDDFQLASALRRTMISMIEEMDNAKKPRYQPIHWAPFFISGSPSFQLSHVHMKV